MAVADSICPVMFFILMDALNIALYLLLLGTIPVVQRVLLPHLVPDTGYRSAD